MNRIAARIAILAALLASIVPAMAQTDGDAAPKLKSAATVAGDIVRIGDLVDNAGAVADVPIFRAPDLGQTGSVPAARVIEAVRSHHILALDSRGLTEVLVTRESRTITATDVEARIVRALAGKYGLPDTNSLAVAFDNPVRPLQVESTATGELAVARLNYEPRGNRFDIAFELPGSAAARRLPLRFTGSISETFATVVPAHELAQGQVVKASDLAIERRPKGELTATTVTTIEQAQGLSARRALRAGQLIRQADLVKPELVARNQSVAMVYEVPGILLTVRGKALEGGALGDVINVLNVESKRTIQATIIGPARVSAGTANRFAANAVP
jgi:flagellar basal body P-ring formation protein FlgA